MLTRASEFVSCPIGSAPVLPALALSLRVWVPLAGQGVLER